jgi:uncharacterized protein (DUF58 family)
MRFMAEAAITTQELFDPDFLESLTRLHIVARRVARGGRHAEQRSKDLGSGIEFRDFRPYSSGDDLRGVDWNIYRRLGRVFLRLFEEFEDLPLYLLTDVSASMFLEEPPRARQALRCALALASIALHQHDSVGLFPFSDDLQITLKPRAGKGRLFRFAEAMSALTPGGATDFQTALRRLGALRLREGLVVIVSDFFDPGGIDGVIDALRHLRHRLLLVQLWRSSDRDPDVKGDLQLIDCETEHAQDVSATAPVVAAYKKAYDRFTESLLGFTRKRKAGLLRLDVEQEVVPQLASLFETGRYDA